MSESIVLTSQIKKPFHHRNGSDELDVFEAAGYFSGATENFSGTQKNTSVNNTQKYSMKPIRRMSLDMPNQRGSSINPLQSMLLDPMVTTKEKKFKQPSSPGGKLAHFLNSLFNQTSLKKSKSKKKSTKDEDESPGGWKRKRKSSISHFSNGNNTTTTVVTANIISDDKSSFSTSSNSGFRTPPSYHVAHTPTKIASYREPVSYSCLKPRATETTKTPLTENLNKIATFSVKNDFPVKNNSFRNGVVEKVKILDEKQEQEQEQHHPYKKFTNDDDGADSDSSSDLFELANCDLGYSCSSGLPVYETTRMDISIKRGAPISS
ncbi:protein BIG GRAIN 1-like E [Bidens hawaiensis]|uniref:protein BIG GRAIN 1-like E n=1 Tax=Bidens hawaiensis TaxID=980011 RepID=UPI00404B5EE3